MCEKYNRAVKLLREEKQQHIIEFLEKLDEEKKEELVNQILKIDFKEIMNLYNDVKTKQEISKNLIEPLKYIDKNKLTEEEQKRYREIGRNAIKSGKYAVATMAGGQGTRLRS